MRRVRREQEDRPLVDRDVVEGGRRRGGVYCLEQHRSSVLVEKFRCCVDVVVCSCVGTADNHDCVAGCRGGRWMVDAVVVNRGLEEMGVFFEPRFMEFSDSD